MKSHNTLLTNHLGSISRHITPLVITILRGGHTETHRDTNIHFTGKINVQKPGMRWPAAGSLLV